MNDAIHKAAILISSLDSKTADSLLDQIDPEQAARIRSAIMDMDLPSEEEQQRVMREFLGRQASPGDPLDEGVELSLSSDRPADGQHGEPDPTPAPATAPTVTACFQQLEQADIDSLARLLQTEHPQTAAVVVAHLPPGRAAEVISRLPENCQTDVLLRVARLESTPLEVIRDIEEEMQAMLASAGARSGYSQQGLAKVAAILQASPTLRCADVFARLGANQRPLAAEPHSAPSAKVPDSPRSGLPLGPTRVERAKVKPLSDIAESIDHDEHSGTNGDRHRVTFAMLESLSDASLAAVIREADAETALLALAGASHAFVHRILRGLPHREARQLERRMQQLGPLRLVDVERAQAALAQLAENLIVSGKLAYPVPQRFAVAA